MGGSRSIRIYYLRVSIFESCKLKFFMLGIVSYGCYIPRNRIKTADIATTWGKDPNSCCLPLRVLEKSVASLDEDSVTMAIEAGKNALLSGEINPEEIGALFFGSESHPYAVNPSATIVGEFLGLGNNYYTADLEFACKAGTTSIINILGLLSTGKVSYGLAIGADKAQSKPGDALEFTACSAAAAFLLGKRNLIAEFLEYVSFSSDTPDFWRRDLVRYPSHAGRFTGEPAYFTHVISATKRLLAKTKLKPADFDYCVFHMPNGKFPREVAKKLGFINEQLEPSLIVDKIGNSYSASSLLGLISVLEIARPNQKILLTSYGSGAGSDSFLIKTTPLITKNQKPRNKNLKNYLESKRLISYSEYLRMMGGLH